MFRKYKPGVSLRIHHTVAASIWSGVGLMLLIRGGSFLFATGSHWLLLLALTIGTCKSLFLLDKSAFKNITRLSKKQEGTCIGGVYSPTMWGLILVMIIMGKVLRNSGLPRDYLGVFYVAIGWALLFSSRLLWNNLKKQTPYDT